MKGILKRIIRALVSDCGTTGTYDGEEGYPSAHHGVLVTLYRVSDDGQEGGTPVSAQNDKPAEIRKAVSHA